MANKLPKDYITRKVLDEAVEAILNGVGSMFSEFGKKIDTRFNKVETRLDRVETEVRYVKDNVRGLKAEFSNTPSRKEFNKLKNKVKSHHPAS